MSKSKRVKPEDIEIIEQVGGNCWQVQIYSSDKKVKRKSHFQIKYEFSAKSKDNTNTENKSSNQLFSDQNHRKDSFNRFGDDLTEFILNFLSLKQKFCFESVSKDWQRLVFNKQLRLTLTNLSCHKHDIDTIDHLIGYNHFPRLAVYPKRLELVLKKCPNIREIYINFNKRFTAPGFKPSVNGTVFDVITNYCHSLKKFTICSKVENLSKDQIKAFVNKFSNSLLELRFKYISDKLIEEFIVSENFPKVRKLDFNTIKRESKQDLAKKCDSFPKLSHLKYTFSGFQGIQVITEPDFSRRLRTLDIVLDTELCEELSGSGVDRALRQISQLKCMEVFNVKIFTEDTTITPIDEGLQRIAKNCLLLKRLDFIMDEIVLLNKLFDVFSQFRALEYCEISIEYNQELEDYGSLEQFRRCLSLKVFNLYLFNINDKHLVDIDVFVPQMTNFHLRSKTGITDSTLNYLKNCKNLQVFEVHTYDDDNTLLDITDSGLYQLIKCCPKLRIVLICSSVKNFEFNQSMEQMMERARSRPKVRHVFGFHGIVMLCKAFAEMHKTVEESSLVLPPNLKLVNLPHWTGIQSFNYYLNLN